ncbi:unnamed protein product [Owenia fusiformis]|uniref:Uncharacterized protein n=1 Tax=Owenia fusiformis TaxID=6347 RepID=A0A8J1XL21_OWEFU|nr:unnamed protein product [Owenia fusiformis]
MALNSKGESAISIDSDKDEKHDNAYDDNIGDSVNIDHNVDYTIKADNVEDDIIDNTIKADNIEDNTIHNVTKAANVKDDASDETIKPDNVEDDIIDNTIKADNVEDDTIHNATKADNVKDDASDETIKPDNVEDDIIDNTIKADNVEDDTIHNATKAANVKDDASDETIKPDNVEDDIIDNTIKADNVEDDTIHNATKADNVKDDASDETIKPDNIEDETDGDIIRCDNVEDDHIKDPVQDNHVDQVTQLGSITQSNNMSETENATLEIKTMDNAVLLESHKESLTKVDSVVSLSNTQSESLAQADNVILIDDTDASTAQTSGLGDEDINNDSIKYYSGENKSNKSTQHVRQYLGIDNLRSQLKEAIEYSNVSRVEEVLEVCTSQRHVSTAVQHLSCSFLNHTLDADVLKVLLDYTCTHHGQGAKGLMALCFACLYGKPDCVYTLLKFGVDPMQFRMYNVECPLLTVLKLCKKNPEIKPEWITIIRLLIEVGMCDVNHIAFGMTGQFIHMAASLDCPEILELFIENGADIDSINEENKLPIHLAVISGKIENIRLLLRHGADINVETSSGLTCLTLAFLFKQFNILEFLLDQGANPDCIDIDGISPFHLALDDDHLIDKVLPKMLEISRKNGGVGINVQCTWTGESLLMCAVQKSCKAVQFLLENNVDLNTEARLGQTAIWFAVKTNNIAACRSLINVNANLNIICNAKHLYNPQTPIQLAVEQGEWQICRMLIQGGCRLDSYRYNNPNRLPASLENNKDMLDYIKGCINTVQSLGRLTKLAIRQHLGSYVEKKLENLPYPKSLKDYIINVADVDDF